MLEFWSHLRSKRSIEAFTRSITKKFHTLISKKLLPLITKKFHYLISKKLRPEGMSNLRKAAVTNRYTTPINSALFLCARTCCRHVCIKFSSGKTSSTNCEQNSGWRRRIPESLEPDNAAAAETDEQGATVDLPTGDHYSDDDILEVGQLGRIANTSQEWNILSESDSNSSDILLSAA